jgi:predicted nucleic acid-binding protein
MASSRAPGKLRLFIDSSVFLAAAFSATGPANALMIEGARRGCALLVSELVLEETRRNLLKASGTRAVAIFELLTGLSELQRAARPSRAQVLRIAKLVNIKDAPIVAAAVRARADYLVSHDKELLGQSAEIQASFGVPVVSPGDILHLVRDS